MLGTLFQYLGRCWSILCSAFFSCLELIRGTSSALDIEHQGGHAKGDEIDCQVHYCDQTAQERSNTRRSSGLLTNFIYEMLPYPKVSPKIPIHVNSVESQIRRISLASDNTSAQDTLVDVVNPDLRLGVMEQRDRDLSATQQGSKTSQESSVFSGKVSLNQDIAFAAGIDEPLPERLETLTLFTWNWVPRDAQDSKAEKIALHLISESEGYFHCVEFKDWVQEATDFSGAVRFLESKYDGLSAMLYYYLRRHAEEYWKYLDVKKVLEKEADPFLFQAVEHACNCFMRRKWVEYSINFQFITDPLKRVLSRSSPIQDMKLDALAVRFRRWYSNSPERVWLQEFDTRTDFLDQLYHMKPEALAIQLSEADLCLFQGLTVDNLMKGSSDVLSALNTRWNNLSCESEECSTAGFDSKLIELIKELYRLSNFYSLTAILLGIHSRGRRLSALEEFNYLIDLNGNYLLYRQCVPPGPALHFLLPFIRIRVGNAAAASMVVSAVREYISKAKLRLTPHN